MDLKSPCKLTFPLFRVPKYERAPLLRMSKQSRPLCFIQNKQTNKNVNKSITNKKKQQTATLTISHKSKQEQTQKATKKKKKKKKKKTAAKKK